MPTVDEIMGRCLCGMPATAAVPMWRGMSLSVCERCKPEALAFTLADYAIDHRGALTALVKELRKMPNLTDAIDLAGKSIQATIQSKLSDKALAVTRFEVIDHDTITGRVYSNQPCEVELSFQDGGRTLKVFVSNMRQGEPVEILDPSSEAGQRMIRNSASDQPLTQGDPPPSAQLYQLVPATNCSPAGIRCLTCGLTSYNPSDVAERYCGNCHRFHGDGR